ncbi:MFS transporter [Acidobacteria bacterium AH-259-A15]|nr:MFS transporter [Acidobacteria bacterium AH-259-A15]
MQNEDGRPTHQRHFLVLLLFLHTLNTYMDRVCISAAKSGMQHDLEMSDQTIGYVFGIFAVGYALFQVPSGWMCDVFGPRKVLTMVVVLWSIFTALTGAVTSAVMLLLVRFLFGVGEAGAYPGATRALYRWVPVKERGIAQGVFHSGARIGAALSLFAMPLLIAWIGWRLTFVANGLVGIAWAAVWWFWFRDEPRQHHHTNDAERTYIEEGLSEDFTPTKTDARDETVPFIQIATSANMLLAMFQYVASNITFFISITWLLPYMEDRWGASSYSALPLLFGAVSLWVSGTLVTHLYQRGFPVASRRLPAMTGFALGAFGLLLCTQIETDSPLLFALAFGIAIFGVEMTISPSWSFCMDIGGDRSGAVSGSMNMLGNLGAAASAVLFPYFVAHVTIPHIAETTGTANSFFAFAATMNVLAVVAWLFMNPCRRLTEKLSLAALRLRIVAFAVMVIVVIAALIYTQFLMG